MSTIQPTPTPAALAQFRHPQPLEMVPDATLAECIAYEQVYVNEELGGDFNDTEYHRHYVLGPLLAEMQRRQAIEKALLAEAAQMGVTPYLTPFPRAILSSPLIFAGTTCTARTILFPASLAGMTSYVGHPATRALLEALGAVTDGAGTPGKYVGPAVGESYLAVPLATNLRSAGWTVDTAIASVLELAAILITRIA